MIAAGGGAGTGAGAGDADGSGEIVAALGDCEVVVRSPGVSVHRPELRALREAGVPVTTATSLWLAERGAAGVIGVTGTKGKSTTAALVCHLARAAGRTARLAGNIGAPALDLLDGEPADVTVLELSSYQIADLQTGPEVALITNLFREHTDWHGSEQAYRADKLRVLGLPGVRVGVLNARDEGLAGALADVGMSARADAETRAGVAAETLPYGVPGGWDVLAEGLALRGELVAASAELPLRGEHNALNLCGALTALEALGVAPPPLPESLHDFRGLAHRLETVAERDGVLWVNDSISTTPESTLAALASFPGREMVLIGGGQDRGQDYARLGRVLAEGSVSVIGVPSTGSRLIGRRPRRRHAACARDRRGGHARGGRARPCAGAAGRCDPAFAGRSELRQLRATSRSAASSFARSPRRITGEPGRRSGSFVRGRLGRLLRARVGARLGQRVDVGCGRRAVLLPDRQPDLLAVDRHAGRCRDPEPDGVAADAHDGHEDLVADDDALSGTTRQDQHRGRL